MKKTIFIPILALMVSFTLSSFTKIHKSVAVDPNYTVVYMYGLNENGQAGFNSGRTAIVCNTGSYLDLNHQLTFVNGTGVTAVKVNDSTYRFDAAASKRRETYAGTTNSSGNYTVTFSTAYSATPNIQANLVGASATNTALSKITSISTTGFTVNVVNRTDVIGLLPSYANVNGATVNVEINEN